VSSKNKITIFFSQTTITHGINECHYQIPFVLFIQFNYIKHQTNKDSYPTFFWS